MIEKCSVRGFYPEVKLRPFLSPVLRSIVPWIKSYGTNPISGEVNSKPKYVEKIIELKFCVDSVTYCVIFSSALTLLFLFSHRSLRPSLSQS